MGHLPLGPSTNWTSVGPPSLPVLVTTGLSGVPPIVASERRVRDQHGCTVTADDVGGILAEHSLGNEVASEIDCDALGEFLSRHLTRTQHELKGRQYSWPSMTTWMCRLTLSGC